MIQVAIVQQCVTSCLLVLSVCLQLQAAEPFQASKPESRSQGGLELVQINRVPWTRIRKGGVFSLKAVVRNAGSAPAVGQLVGRIAGQTGEEDRRQIELAAGEQKDFDLRLRISADFKNAKVDAIVTLNAIENGREVLLQKGDEPVSQTSTLPVDEELVATAITLAPEPPDGPYWHDHLLSRAIPTRSAVERIRFGVAMYPIPR